MLNLEYYVDRKVIFDLIRKSLRLSVHTSIKKYKFGDDTSKKDGVPYECSSPITS